MIDYLLLTAGLVLLVVGGELLVRGAADTASRLGMSPLLIGLTLVGFGTSTPELVTSVQASLSGSPGIAIGNIVGSNIANILLILGVAATITPIAVSQRALMRDGLFVVITAIAFVSVGFLTTLDRPVGAVFFVSLAAYLYYAYRQESANAPAGHTAAYEKQEAHDELLGGSAGAVAATAPGVPSTSRSFAAVRAPLAMALGGLIVILFGGMFLVDGATGVARQAGVSETVIGLTVVAIGTSLPELVTSIVAALRKHGDVALGNILGSNIYNILAIGGVTALIAPTEIPQEIVRFDNLVMLAVSILLLVVAYTGYRVTRGEGVMLLAGYGTYLWVVWPA